MAGKEFPLSVVIRAIDRVTAPMGAIQRKIGAFDKAIGSKMQAVGDKLGLPVLSAAAGRFGSAIGDLGARVAKITAGVAALGTTAAIAAYSMIQSFADLGGKINDVSKSIGVSAEALQEWRYAAKQNGVEAELLDNSLSILSKNLGKAIKDGKGGAADLLKAMGINPKSIKSVEDAFPRIADGLVKIKNPALRAAAAAELFGKSGVKMLPALLGDEDIGTGAKALKHYADRARELGIVLSNKTVSQADEFGDKMDDLKASISGARNTIGTALLPVMTKLTERFTNWIVSIRPQLQAWFEKFAENLPDRIESAIKAFDDMKAAIQPVIDAFTWLSEKFGAGNVVIAALVGAVTIFLLPALYATATALYAVGVAILATPIGWIILGVTALVAGLTYLYNRSEAVRTVLDAVGKVLVWLWSNGLKPAIQAIGELVAGIVELTAKVLIFAAEFVAGFGNAIKDGVNAGLKWITDFGAKLVGLVPDWVKNLFGGKGSASVNIGGAGPAMGAAAAGAQAAAAQNGEVRVRVDLNNLPPGSRASTDQKGKTNFELNQGYASAFGS